MYRSHVLVCGGTGCTSSGSERIVSALEREIQDNGLSRKRSRSSKPAASAFAH